VRAVDHAGNKGPWSEAQRVWIDTKGPSAPVIAGGSEDWATDRTISVKTDATDGASGVAYYEYYCTNTSIAPDTSTVGTKVTTSETSQLFNTDMNGYYVYFRAIDGAGNIGTWSNVERLFIDTQVPVVTLVNEEQETIDAGTIYDVAGYFNIVDNGLSPSTITYKVGETEIANTEELAVSDTAYEIVCTVTKATGGTASATKSILVQSALPTEETEIAQNNVEVLATSSCTGASTYKSTFTVPEGVSVLKVVLYNKNGTGNIERVWTGGTDGVPTEDSPHGGTSWAPAGGQVTSYVGVTPGKTYSVKYCGQTTSDYCKFYYSTSINQMTPTHIDY